MGRSFEMIAAACADRPIMLWQIARRSEANGLAGSADSAGGGGDSSGGGGEDDETDPWVIVGPAVELSEDDTGRQQQPSLGAGAMAPRSKVFRVEWNVTGTILASSADDGTVKLWKAVMSGADGKKWVSASIVTDEDSTR
jgi:nucleoporin SEH1